MTDLGGDELGRLDSPEPSECCRAECNYPNWIRRSRWSSRSSKEESKEICRQRSMGRKKTRKRGRGLAVMMHPNGKICPYIYPVDAYVCCLPAWVELKPVATLKVPYGFHGWGVGLISSFELVFKLFLTILYYYKSIRNLDRIQFYYYKLLGTILEFYC